MTHPAQTPIQTNRLLTMSRIQQACDIFSTPGFGSGDAVFSDPGWRPQQPTLGDIRSTDRPSGG